MNRICLAIGMIALLLLAGCKSSQVLPDQQPVSTEAQDNFEALVASYPDWETFSSKGEVKIKLNSGKSLSASTQVKMIRGEMLQISVRVILGVEVARIVVTPDDVIVMNKLKRQVVNESLAELSERLSTPLSLETIQDALLGRVFLIESEKNHYTLSDFDLLEEGDSRWMLSPRRQDDRYSYRFELQGIQLLKTYAGSTGGSKSVVCQYSDFVQQHGSENFPTTMSLELKGLSMPISLDLSYSPSSISWNGTVKVDKLNLSKYTEVTISQILKML